ncbi:hypothetical protein BDP27DRAFT_1363705 [Rhodocollybia butyracea]|uniref:Uncharacterized protein n=1 Tax=Rhodocollybia butyracea TaxID=206335 RepID=A0A9P5PTB1_9AGAR|nr:hypothetical protein BDP27DRAFT_1363705 [Rhodocollybia butyracea]
MHYGASGCVPTQIRTGGTRFGYTIEESKSAVIRGSTRISVKALENEDHSHNLNPLLNLGISGGSSFKAEKFSRDREARELPRLRRVSSKCAPMTEVFQGSILKVLDFPKLELPAKCRGWTHALEFDVERMRCAEIIDEIRSGAPSSLGDLDNLVLETQSTLDHYEVELECLKSLIDSIEGRASRIRLYKEGILSMKAPVRTLPDDVLGSIFKLICCTHAQFNYIGFRRMQTLMISQLKHPMLSIFLKRSCLHTLDVKLDQASYVDKASAPVDISGFLTSASTDRWRSAVLGGKGDRVFPELHHLKINNLATSQTCFNGSATFRFTHPCAAGKYLTLGALSSDAVFHILENFPNVWDLCLGMKQGPSPMVPVDLTFLYVRTLEFYVWGRYYESLGILNSFTTPGLTHFSFKSRSPECIASHSLLFLSSWIEQKRPPLTHLSIQGVSFTSKEILDLFYLLPSLQSFDCRENKQVPGGGAVDQLLLALTPPQFRASEDDKEFIQPWKNNQNHIPVIILPILRALLLAMELGERKLDLLANLLRARKENLKTVILPQLQKVELGAYPREKLEREILALQKQNPGLDIQISDSDVK